MDEAMTTYNSYVEEEEALYKQLETLELCQCAILDHIYRYGEQFNKLTAEEVLLCMYQLEDTTRLELLHLKLAKAFLAFELKHN